MEKDGKIIEFGCNNICLFCGEKQKTKYEEYQVYFECDCADAVKDRTIQEQIRKLESLRPEHKYEIRKEDVLFLTFNYRDKIK